MTVTVYLAYSIDFSIAIEVNINQILTLRTF
jgi:hypothetical protein